MVLAVGLLGGLLILWCVVTGVLIVLLIYRSLLGMREEDQLFLDRAEDHVVREQREIVRKILKLSPYVTGLGITSGIGLVIMVALWVYEGLTATP